MCKGGIVRKLLLTVMAILFTTSIVFAESYGYIEYVNVITSGPVTINWSRPVEEIWIIKKDTFTVYVDWQGSAAVSKTSTAAECDVLDLATADEERTQKLHATVTTVCVDHDSGLSVGVDFRLIGKGGTR
jgi:hypothetical protein